MNIVPMYLLVYYKKGKQRFKVVSKKEVLEWIKNHPDEMRMTFKLIQVEFSMSDTYEIAEGVPFESLLGGEID